MLAKIVDVAREEHPYDVPTPVVVTTVEYHLDSGELHSVQRYAMTPAQLGDDFSIFNRQAESMQRDIDEAKSQQEKREAEIARNRPVDEVVDRMRNHFNLNFADAVPVEHLGR